MSISFTPHYVIQQHRRRLLAGLLLLVLTATATHFLIQPHPTTATDSTTWQGAALTNGSTDQTRVDSDHTITLGFAGTSSIDTAAAGDFRRGYSDPTKLNMTAINESGEVVLNQGWSYTTKTDPGLADNRVSHTFRDNDFLYVSTRGGLSVIDTQGTADPTDDTPVTRYHTGSDPALANNDVEYTFLDNNLLYTGTFNGGLSVIDTKGTAGAGDDTLAASYFPQSTSILRDDDITNIEKKDNLLYVSTFLGGNAGLFVLDTQDTATSSDDTLAALYNNSTTPAILTDNNRISTFLLADNLIYIGTNDDGLFVLDTQDTATSSDDALVATYDVNSSPLLGSNHINDLKLNKNQLYVSTNGGLSVIDTEGTATSTDDTLVARYHTGSDPALVKNVVQHTFRDNGFLYVSTWGGGLSVIDTQGTANPTDDTLVTRYHTGSDPALANNRVSHTFRDNDRLYVSTEGGLSVIDLSNQYVQSAAHVSAPESLTTFAPRILTQARTGDTALSYRTGTSAAAWRSDFDDGVADEYLGDHYNWGHPFQSAVESNGTLKLSDPNQYLNSNDNSGADGWIDTGKPDEFFPIGSRITVRFRINSETRQQQDWTDYFFTDDWWDSVNDGFIPNNQWRTLSFQATSKAFSKIGFEIGWRTGTWDMAADSLEIDYIEIIPPDSFGAWNEWSDPCSAATCAVDSADLTDQAWIQYRLDLQTDDRTTTPTVSQVGLHTRHATSGTYTSKTETFGRSQELVAFDATVTTPTSTSVTFAYSTDDGRTWRTIAPGDSFPEDTTTDTLTWRATLTTTDPAVSAQIHRVTVDHTPTPRSSSGVSVQTRAANLEAQGKSDAAAALREQYSQQFSDSEPTGPDGFTSSQRRAIIDTLQDIRSSLQRIIELRRGETSSSTR